MRIFLPIKLISQWDYRGENHVWSTSTETQTLGSICKVRKLWNVWCGNGLNNSAWNWLWDLLVMLTVDSFPKLSFWSAKSSTPFMNAKQPAIEFNNILFKWFCLSCYNWPFHTSICFIQSWKYSTINCGNGPAGNGFRTKCSDRVDIAWH